MGQVRVGFTAVNGCECEQMLQPSYKHRALPWYSCLQVQRTIGVSDYVRRDLALKNLIQPLAGEYGMHNNQPQREWDVEQGSEVMGRWCLSGLYGMNNNQSQHKWDANKVVR